MFKVRLLLTVRTLFFIRITDLGEEETFAPFLGLSPVPLDGLLAFLFLPLIEATTELAVPSLGGLEVSHLAQSFGLCPDVLLGQKSLVVNFGVES